MTLFQSLQRLFICGIEEKKRAYISLAMVPVMAMAGFLEPIFLKRAVDLGAAEKNVSVFVTYVLFFIALKIALYGFQVLQMICFRKFICACIKNMRMKLTAHILKQKMSFHDGVPSSHLHSRSTHDLAAMSGAVSVGVLKLLVEFVSLFGSFIALFTMEATLSLVVLVAMILGVLFTRYTTRSVKVLSLRCSTLAAQKKFCLHESLYLLKTVKLYALEKIQFQKFKNITSKLRKTLVQHYLTFLVGSHTVTLLSSLSVGLILYFIAYKMFGITTINPGTLVVFIHIVRQIFSPMIYFNSTIQSLQTFFVNCQRVQEVFSLNHVIEGNQPLTSTQPDITFDKVNFGYERISSFFDTETKDKTKQNGLSSLSSKKVLKNVSFKVPYGSFYGIAGITGSSKSTIAKLLVKLYDGYRGSIKLADQELRDLDPVSVQNHIALINQKVTLFSGSIAYNIGLGKKEATLDEIYNAAKKARAHDFIMQLDHGYDYEISEEGANLSQGQKQLISLARALCQNASIMIFDEVTSALSPEIESQITEAMKSLQHTRTLIIIAHHLHTLAYCDEILVLRDGEVVEKGHHRKLIAQKRHYYELYNSSSKMSS
ncbi:MAG: ABC transporter ATP-binding protein [Proteobacteria bacterium]|nr:ABC transporter ATP-binding protein [Pseudomonadota bacterium]